MNDLKLNGLTGKTIKEAEVDGFGIRIVFTDGAVFEYSASDGGYSQYELTEATAEAMQKQSDHTADVSKKVSIPCAHENDPISRQMAFDTIMGQPPEPHYPSWYAAQIEKLPAAQPATNCSESPNSSDIISRQAAIDALWKALYTYEDETERRFQESDELNVGDWIGHRIFVQNMNDIDRQTILNLPSAQPEEVIPHRNYKYLSDYWCECGWHLGKKGEVKYCSNCGRKVNWDE